MACTANNTQNVTLQIKVRRALPLPLCRWWLKTRPCSRGIQLGPPNTPPAVEFYVPWWAWPLEWLHRLVFGAVVLCHGLKEELKDGNRSRMREYDKSHRWD